MNRKLLVVVAFAAVIALLAGAAVGRNLLSQSTPPAPQADVVRFKDDVSKTSIAYPATWTKAPDLPNEPDRALLVSPGGLTSLLMRVSSTGFEPITQKGLPVVKKFTDGLLAEDTRISQLVPPVAVNLGGLPGWRYRYVFKSGNRNGAHDHYFLFKDARMIQLVFQAVPAKRLPELAPTFDEIAESFHGDEQ